MTDAPVPSAPHRLLGRHHGLLGTVIETTIESSTVADAAYGEQRFVDEVCRLERVFSVFDERSELCRWERRQAVPGAELSEVLDLSADWHDRSGGAFNPAVGELLTQWSRASATGTTPSTAALRSTARSIRHLPYAVVDGEVVATGALGGLNLNAIAKGWIVDRATDVALSSDSVAGVVANAGGDLLNRGSRTLLAGIEDPLRPFDNVEPLVRVAIPPGVALATSGGSRRGWQIGRSRYSHVLDPRTGSPVDHVASASVVAPTTVQADVLATILTVLPVAEGVALVDTLDGAACFIVAPEGRWIRSSGWSDYELR